MNVLSIMLKDRKLLQLCVYPDPARLTASLSPQLGLRPTFLYPNPFASVLPARLGLQPRYFLSLAWSPASGHVFCFLDDRFSYECDRKLIEKTDQSQDKFNTHFLVDMNLVATKQTSQYIVERGPILESGSVVQYTG